MRNVLVAILLLAAACSTTGRDLPPPTGPGPAVSPVASPDETRTIFPRTVGEDAMAVFGSDFEPGGVLPADHGIIGGGSPIEVEWTGVTPDAVELAMVVLDVDNADFIHWVVVGIDPALDFLDANPLPAGVVQLPNDTGATGWLPLSPVDGVTHRYQVWLYALTEGFGLDPITATATEARLWLDANAASIATVMGILTGPTCAETHGADDPACTDGTLLATLPQRGVTVPGLDGP